MDLNRWMDVHTRPTSKFPTGDQYQWWIMIKVVSLYIRNAMPTVMFFSLETKDLERMFMMEIVGHGIVSLSTHLNSHTMMWCHALHVFASNWHWHKDMNSGVFMDTDISTAAAILCHHLPTFLSHFIRNLISNNFVKCACQSH